MVSKFVCNKQGCCCKNLRRNKPELQKDMDKTNQCGPMYHLLPAVEIGLVFYSFEKEFVEAVARDNKVKMTFVPELVLIDDKRKKVLVLAYSLVENDCPLLDENNLCQIYDYRPLICRQYPLLNRMVGENKFDIRGLDCPLVELKTTNLQGDYSNMVKSLGEYFGYDVVAANEIEMSIFKQISEIVKYLVEERENPYFRAIRKPLKYIQPKMKGFEYIDFHEFIKSLPGFETNKMLIRLIPKETFVGMASELEKNFVKDSVSTDLSL